MGLAALVSANLFRAEGAQREAGALLRQTFLRPASVSYDPAQPSSRTKLSTLLSTCCITRKYLFSLLDRDSCSAREDLSLNKVLRLNEEQKKK